MIFPENHSNNINNVNIDHNQSSKHYFQNHSPSSSSTNSSQHNTVFLLNSPISKLSYPLYLQTSDYFHFPKESKKQFKGRNFIPKSRLVINSKLPNMQSYTQSSFHNNEQEPCMERPVTLNLMSQYFFNNYYCSNTFNVINNPSTSFQFNISSCENNNLNRNNNNETYIINNYKTNNYINTTEQGKIQKSKSNTNNVITKKENPYENIPIDFLIQNACFLCGNQGGCRHLQKVLEQYPHKAMDFYEQIRNKIYDLSLDSFGNYFIQKLLEYLPVNSLLSIFVESFAKDFLSLCISPHGTRVMQKFLERTNNYPDIMNLFNPFFYNHISDIILDSNATHIVIKYFTLIKYPQNEQLFTFFKNNILMLSTNKHSCCTIQKCIEVITNQQQLYEIINSIANVSQLLFNDQYGNYIVQYSLGFNIEELNSIIIDKYFSNIDTFAYQKIASNVFEKCLQYCSMKEKASIIQYLCNKEIVRKLLLNTYGNYILRQAMQYSEEQEKQLFIEYISEYLSSLKVLLLENVTYSKLLKKFPEILV